MLCVTQLLWDRMEPSGVCVGALALACSVAIYDVSVVALVTHLRCRWSWRVWVFFRRCACATPCAGYLDSVSTDPLPNTPAHRVIMQYGLADAQVTWLGAHTMARSIGASMFSSNVRYVGVTAPRVMCALGPRSRKLRGGMGCEM